MLPTLLLADALRIVQPFCVLVAEIFHVSAPASVAMPDGCMVIRSYVARVDQSAAAIAVVPFHNFAPNSVTAVPLVFSTNTDPEKYQICPDAPMLPVVAPS